MNMKWRSICSSLPSPWNADLSRISAGPIRSGDPSSWEKSTTERCCTITVRQGSSHSRGDRLLPRCCTQPPAPTFRRGLPGLSANGLDPGALMRDVVAIARLGY
jgi:hypothetical protein